jgi:hypothetical protein
VHKGSTCRHRDATALWKDTGTLPQLLISRANSSLSSVTSGSQPPSPLFNPGPSESAASQISRRRQSKFWHEPPPNAILKSLAPCLRSPGFEFLVPRKQVSKINFWLQGHEFSPSHHHQEMTRGRPLPSTLSRCIESSCRQRLRHVLGASSGMMSADARGRFWLLIAKFQEGCGQMPFLGCSQTRAPCGAAFVPPQRVVCDWMWSQCHALAFQ